MKFQADTSSKTIMALAIIAVLVFALLTGCAPAKKKTVNGNIDPIANASALGKVLGCVFAPAECAKYKKEIDQKQQQESITKEFDAVDKDKSK
jgi:hypothetical protein